MPPVPEPEPAPPPPSEVAETVKSADEGDTAKSEVARKKRGKSALIIEREPSTGQSGAGLQV